MRENITERLSKKTGETLYVFENLSLSFSSKYFGWVLIKIKQEDRPHIYKTEKN